MNSQKSAFIASAVASRQRGEQLDGTRDARFMPRTSADWADLLFIERRPMIKKIAITPLQRSVLVTLSCHGRSGCDDLTSSLRWDYEGISTFSVQRSVEALHRKGLVRIRGNAATITLAGYARIGAWFTLKGQDGDRGALASRRAEMRKEAK